MFRTTSIKKRLMFMAIASTCAVVFTAFVGLFGLFKNGFEIERQIATTEALHDIMRADMMHEGLAADVAGAIVLGETADEADRATMLEEVAQDAASLRAALDHLGTLDLPEVVYDKLQALSPMVVAFTQVAEEAVVTSFANPTESWKVLTAFKEEFKRIAAPLEELTNIVEDLAREAGAGSKALDRQLMLVLAVVFVIATLTNLWIIRNVGLSILKPIDRLRDALRDVAEGDFSIRIARITREDDIGAIGRDIDRVTERVEHALVEQARSSKEAELAIQQLGAGLDQMAHGDLNCHIGTAFSEIYEPLRGNFNETVEKLSALVAGIRDAGATIAERSGKIGAATENLAMRTEKQAATLEQTTAALDEITVNIGQVADHAKRVESTVEKAGKDAEASGEIVSDAIESMGLISASSDEISTIIGLIDDITFQTNLLALNAGVEAARAGEAGRGFAVVASEVRGLAQRSSEAAQDIKTLISKSGAQIEEGVTRVDQVGRALKSVISHVTEISSFVGQIAQGTREQAQGLAEINTGMVELDRVGQENAAMVMETEEVTSVLGREMTEMRDLVGQFSLGGASHDARQAPAPQNQAAA